MKITLTGITKEEAIRKLEAAAIENRAFAARITYKPVSDNARHAADRYEALSETITAADGNCFRIIDTDEGHLFIALADGAFETNPVYTITPEVSKEIPWEIGLARGALEAAKTENL